MMDCREITIRRDDYLDGTLPAGQIEAIETHADQCPACQTMLDSDRRLLAELRTLPASMPDQAWFDRALADAIEDGIEQGHVRRRRRWLGIGGALAASLVLAIGFNIDRSPGGHSPGQPLGHPVAEAAPGFSLALNEEREVNLVFESPRSLDSATFTVILPEGIELSGFPGHNQVTWQGRLESGENLLVLPLRAATGNGGDVVTHVASTGKRKTFTLRMKVEPVTSM